MEQSVARHNKWHAYLSAHLFLFFSFFFLLFHERESREKQYHSHSLLFRSICFGLCCLQWSAFITNWNDKENKGKNREQNGRYGIILSSNNLTEQTSKYSGVLLFLLFCWCVSVVWKQLRSNNKTQKTVMHTQWRLNSCYTVKNHLILFCVVVIV